MPAPASILATQYLQFCLRGRFEPGALADARALTGRANFDWQAAAEAARANVVLPLLFDALRDEPSVPATLRQKLRAAYVYTARRNRTLLAEAGNVARTLQGAGVAALALKGPALAASVYPDAGVRPIRDLDFLVGPRRLAAAVRALEAQGFQAVNAAARSEAVIKFAGEVALRKSDIVETLVELHTEAVQLAGRPAVPAGWGWQPTRTVELGGTKATTLGPEAQMVYLPAHIWRHHRENGLLWLNDAAEVVWRDAERIDWDKVVASVLQYGLAEAVEPALARLAEGWGAPVPPSVLRRLAEGGRARPAVAGQPARAQGPRWWHLAFPPMGYIQRRYHVGQAVLTPWYYLIRWVELIRGRRT